MGECYVLAWLADGEVQGLMLLVSLNKKLTPLISTYSAPVHPVVF